MSALVTSACSACKSGDSAERPAVIESCIFKGFNLNLGCCMSRCYRMLKNLVGNLASYLW